jgi:hypothetical protein
MGWLARVIVTSCTTAVVGCASLAGLGEGSDPTPEQPLQDAVVAPGSPASSGASSSGSDASPGGARADATVDGPADATPDTAPPPCTKTALGGGCAASNDCCSGHCSETRLCTTSCRSLGSSCFNGGESCCIGNHCNGAFCVFGP